MYIIKYWCYLFLIVNSNHTYISVNGSVLLMSDSMENRAITRTNFRSTEGQFL